MYDAVQEYYGKVLTTNKDLQTNACCSDEVIPLHIKEALSRVHDEVMVKYYGCGLIVPEELAGLSILDMGSGSGRDCYVLSQLVGEEGNVVGVDMTNEQLAVAERHIDYHRREFGYNESNVRFLNGFIEKLDQLELEPASFDLIVSNCVLNLSPDKESVLRHAWNLLKPGGEMYFSDVYADRRVPGELVDDPVLRGECLGGALYWNDFIELARQTGFRDPRLVEDRPLTIGNSEVADRVWPVNFYSATYRLFRIDSLESSGEDYGQAVVYQGGLENSPDSFKLDKYNVFEKGSRVPVSGNTWQMLKRTRFSRHFDFHDSGCTHQGLFKASGDTLPFNPADSSQSDSSNKSAGCC